MEESFFFPDGRGGRVVHVDHLQRRYDPELKIGRSSAVQCAADNILRTDKQHFEAVAGFPQRVERTGNDVRRSEIATHGINSDPYVCASWFQFKG